jgi:hypothetical protein
VGSAFDVVPAALVVAEAIEDDDIEGVVCAAIAAAVQPVPVDAAAAGRDGGNSAQVGERCLRSDPLRVVAGAGEELAGDLWADLFLLEGLQTTQFKCYSDWL